MKVSLTIARVRGEFIDGAGADMKNLIRDIQRRRPMRYNKTSFSGFVAQIFKQTPFGFPRRARKSLRPATIRGVRKEALSRRPDAVTDPQTNRLPVPRKAVFSPFRQVKDKFRTGGVKRFLHFLFESARSLFSGEK